MQQNKMPTPKKEKKEIEKFLIWSDLELQEIKGKLEDMGILIFHKEKYFYMRNNEKMVREPEEIKDLLSFLVRQAMMMTTGAKYVPIYKPELKEWHCYK